MENQITQNSTDPKKGIPFDLDSEIDSLDFKPITKGLGFHHEQKRPSQVSTTLSSKTKVQSSNLSFKSPKSTIPEKNHEQLSGLEKFYSKEINSPAPVVKSPRPTASMNTLSQHSQAGTRVKPKKIAVLESASIGDLIISYLTDLLLISGLLGITFYLLFRVVGIGPEEILSLLPKKEGHIYITLLFSIFYLFYFTVLDLTSSPGKALLGLRLKTIKKEKLEMRHTFTRSLISLCSIPLLFLPLMFDLQGKLSGTKVVK